jgi:hypothetical protein
MATKTSDERPREPDEASLAATLGQLKTHWDAIVQHAEKECGGLVREWKFYGQKYGWQLKFSDKKRVVLYLIPREGRLLAAMALRPPAIEALREHGLPPALLREVEAARAGPEGKPARVEVNSKKDVDIVKQLLAIKLSR